MAQRQLVAVIHESPAPFHHPVEDGGILVNEVTGERTVLPVLGNLHVERQYAQPSCHSVRDVFQIRQLVGIGHEQGNVPCREVLAVYPPCLYRLSRNDRLQGVRIAAELPYLNLRAIVQTLAVHGRNVHLTVIAVKKDTYSEIAHVVTSKYTHDGLKDHRLSVAPASLEDKHRLNLGKRTVNEHRTEEHL